MRSRELQIVTPEAVVLNLPTAGLGSRFLARGLDLLIQVVMFVILLFATGIIGSTVGGASGAAGTAALVFFLILLTIIWLGYAIVLETLWRGRTPGKAALGLRVVTNEGAPIRFRHALVRGILGLVDVWVSGGSIGVLTILISRDEQRFGDMAAGTIVVRDRSGAQAPSATVFAPPPGCDEYVAHLDVSGIDPAVYEAVRSFLIRAHALGPAARADIATRLATPLLQRLRHTPPSWMGPELWLACLAAAYQRRHGGGWPAGYPGYGGGWPAPGYRQVAGPAWRQQGNPPQPYPPRGYPPPGAGPPGYPPPGAGYQPPPSYPPPGAGYQPPPSYAPPQGYPAQGYGARPGPAPVPSGVDESTPAPAPAVVATPAPSDDRFSPPT